ncbi:MAG: DUF1304 domain-containing protein [Culicoidibacterales bacterium]
MNYITIFLALVVALEHIYILVLEMFLADTERASNAFSIDLAFLKQKESKIMMANQGLYNGFLAAGIIFGLFIVPENARLMVTLFFLGCVIVAAVYGAMSATKKILLIQGLPAIISFVCCIYFL